MKIEHDNCSYFFNLDSRPTVTNEHLIFFNLNYGIRENGSNPNKLKYIPMRISTRKKIKKEYWDSINFRATQAYVRKYGIDLNNDLIDIQKTSIDQLKIFRNTYNQDPTPKELKRIIEEKLERIKKVDTDVLLVPFIEDYIGKRINIKNDTKKQYNNLVRHLKQYEEIKNTKLILGKLTTEWYWDFFDVVNNKYFEENEVYLTQTTVAKDCKNLRAVFNEAIENDIPIGFNHQKKGMKIQEKKKSYELFLTPIELQKIIDTNVSHMKSFIHAKNYIILSSFTGLRIGDMKFLNEIKPNIETRNGVDCLCFYTKIRKNQEVNEDLFVSIPILKPVKELLDNNCGTFPKIPADQVIRRYIKNLLRFLEFGDEVVITNYYYKQSKDGTVEYKQKHEVFSPHDCRATFITNLKQLGLHNETIEPITHPKHNAKEILNKYDKSDLVDNAIKFIDALETINETRKKKGLEVSIYTC